MSYLGCVYSTENTKQCSCVDFEDLNMYNVVFV